MFYKVDSKNIDSFKSDKEYLYWERVYKEFRRLHSLLEEKEKQNLKEKENDKRA